MNRIEQLYQEQPGATSFARGYLDYLSELFAKLDTDQIAAFIEILWQAREREARIFFIGNGGSAATASHFANDIAIGTRSWLRPFRAISLTDNVAVLTAIGNDYGYAEIFTSQLKALMVAGDVVVAISASGNSPNVIQAVEYANQHGAITVGLSGFDGGKLKQLAQLAVHVPTNTGEYGPVEDVHLILDHLVGSFLLNKCSSENGNRQ
jgi:D-sedoheptulose 7-phosphate isomerase